MVPEIASASIYPARNCPGLCEWKRFVHGVCIATHFCQDFVAKQTTCKNMTFDFIRLLCPQLQVVYESILSLHFEMGTCEET